MNKNELLNITTEECAEVIQAISKVNRFGWDGTHPSFPDGQTNKDHLVEEMGDLYCMLDLVIKEFNLDTNQIHEAMRNKLEKLKKWSGYKA